MSEGFDLKAKRISFRFQPQESIPRNLWGGERKLELMWEVLGRPVFDFFAGGETLGSLGEDSLALQRFGVVAATATINHAVTLEDLDCRIVRGMKYGNFPTKKIACGQLQPSFTPFFCVWQS